MKNNPAFKTTKKLLATLDNLSTYYGAKCLEELVHHPNQPIHATQLRNLFNQPVIPEQAGTPAVLTELPYTVNPRYELHIEKADQKAIDEVKQHLIKVLERIALAREFNDIGALEDLYDERDKLTKWLKQAVNIHGRPRYFADNTQKDYQTIQKNIVTIITKIEEIDPALARYIKQHLKTGHRFVWVK